LALGQYAHFGDRATHAGDVGVEGPDSVLVEGHGGGSALR
jgi:hypothetical protein